MRKRILAANWKMNGSKAMLKPFFDQFFKIIDMSSLSSPQHKLYFGMPYLYLEGARSYILNGKITLSAQNCHWAESGAFTGEISPVMLQDFGINTVIIGHSERRQFFNETEETLDKKLHILKKLNMQVIYCIGESLEQKEAKETLKVLQMQLKTLFTALPNKSDLERVVLAYEPIWAIGTGLAATPEQAQEVHRFIRGTIAEAYDIDSAEKISLLYGGSSNASNIVSLLVQPDIDGFLVGGAALKPEEFGRMWRDLSQTP